MFLIYDCHVHTNEVSACGLIDAAEMVELYQRANYTGIVITDHYYDYYFEHLDGTWAEKIEKYLSGYTEAKKRGQELDVEVLLGLELRFAGTPEDYLVYGVDRNFLLEYPRLDQLGLKKFSLLAKKHNLLVVQAHPFRSGLQVAEAQYLDGIEIFNGNPRHDSHNDLALAYAQQHSLIQLACSDAHQYQDVARAGIYLPVRVRTSAELVEVLREHPVLPKKIP